MITLDIPEKWSPSQYKITITKLIEESSDEPEVLNLESLTYWDQVKVENPSLDVLDQQQLLGPWETFDDSRNAASGRKSSAHLNLLGIGSRPSSSSIEKGKPGTSSELKRALKPGRSLSESKAKIEHADLSLSHDAKARNKNKINDPKPPANRPKGFGARNRFNQFITTSLGVEKKENHTKPPYYKEAALAKKYLSTSSIQLPRESSSVVSLNFSQNNTSTTQYSSPVSKKKSLSYHEESSEKFPLVVARRGLPETGSGYEQMFNFACRGRQIMTNMKPETLTNISWNSPSKTSVISTPIYANGHAYSPSPTKQLYLERGKSSHQLKPSWEQSNSVFNKPSYAKSEKKDIRSELKSLFISDPPKKAGNKRGKQSLTSTQSRRLSGSQLSTFNLFRVPKKTTGIILFKMVLSYSITSSINIKFEY